MVTRTYAEYKGKIYKWNELLNKLNLDNDGYSSGRIQFYKKASSKQIENTRCLIKNDDEEYEEICNYCEEFIDNCHCDIDSNTNVVHLIQKTNNLTKRHYQFIWNRDVGNSKSGNCYVCDRTITDDNFEAGHIIAKSNGGNNHVSNLRVVCLPCNRAMGTTNLEEFKKDFINESLESFNKEVFLSEITKEDVIQFLETHKPNDRSVNFFNKAIELLEHCQE